MLSTFRSASALAALAALLLGCATASGDVIVNTFGPGGSVGANNFTFGISAQPLTLFAVESQLAVGFTPLHNITLDRIADAIATTQGISVPFALSVVADNNGSPTGQTLESFVATANTSPTLGSVLSLSRPALLAGQRYWILAASTNPFPSFSSDTFGWSLGQNPAGLSLAMGSAASTPPFLGPSWSVNDTPAAIPALEAEGTPVQAATAPEPSSLALLGVGLARVGCRWWRRRKRRTPQQGFHPCRLQNSS
jgi:hypothetical protein